MISFTNSVFVFEEGNWTEVSWVNISYAQETRARIEIQTDSGVQQGISLRIGYGPYEITVDLTEEEVSNLPFKRKKYTTVKLFNQQSKVIIAVSSSEEDSVVKSLLSQLIFYTKFTKSCVVRQVELNLAEMLLDSFVTTLRHKFPSKDRHTKDLAFQLQQFLESIGVEFGTELSPKEIHNIVYKAVLYHGMFPIEVQLKDSNYGYISQRLHKFMYDESTPWSNSLASSIKIGRDIFQDHQAGVNHNRQLVKFRILDFFPLDSWVNTMADFLVTRMDRFMINLKQATGPSLERLPSHSDSLNEPLLAHTSSSTDKVRDNLYRLFLQHGAGSLYSQIALQFYTYYNMQLTESRAFRQIAKVIANSMKNDHLLHRPNQMVSSIVSIVHEGLKKIAEPLTLSSKLKSQFEGQIHQLEQADSIKEFKKAVEKLDNDKFLLYTKYATERDLLSYVPPVCAEKLLDYFGFFTDAVAKEFFFDVLQKVRHHTFRSLWSQFKEVEEESSSVSHYSSRRDFAQSYLQSHQSTRPTIDKKELKQLCILIIMHQNEKGEREKDHCKNLLFWYYNSVRLRNSYKYNKLPSCIGSVIVKDTI